MEDRTRTFSYQGDWQQGGSEGRWEKGNKVGEKTFKEGNLQKTREIQYTQPSVQYYLKLGLL